MIRNENPFTMSWSVMSCPKRASRLNRQDKCILTVSVHSLIRYLISNLFFLANEFTINQNSHNQTLTPWTHYEDSLIMARPSELSTFPGFSISNSYYNHVGPSHVMESPTLTGNLPSLIRPKPSFQTTVLPDEPVIKTKVEVMANVPRSFNGVRFPSMFKESAFDCSFSHLPAYPDFKPLSYDLPTLAWIQPT